MAAARRRRVSRGVHYDHARYSDQHFCIIVLLLDELFIELLILFEFQLDQFRVGIGNRTSKGDPTKIAKFTKSAKIGIHAEKKYFTKNR